MQTRRRMFKRTNQNSNFDFKNIFTQNQFYCTNLHFANSCNCEFIRFNINTTIITSIKSNTNKQKKSKLTYKMYISSNDICFFLIDLAWKLDEHNILFETFFLSIMAVLFTFCFQHSQPCKYQRLFYLLRNTQMCNVMYNSTLWFSDRNYKILNFKTNLLALNFNRLQVYIDV